MKAKKVSTEAFVDKRKMTIEDKENFFNTIFSELDGKHIRLTAESIAGKITNSLRGYWFAEYVAKARLGFTEAGYRMTPTQVHHTLMMLFDPQEIILPTGEIVVVPGSIADDADNNTTRMLEVMEEAAQFIAEEFGLVVDPPRKGKKVRVGFDV